MIRMICLANSWREGGRCIAGIDICSGKWIRPVPPGGGPIPEKRTIVGRKPLAPLNRKPLAPLDVVELDLARPTLSTRYQCENCQIQDWKWRVVDRVEAHVLLPYCGKSAIVLHSYAKVVSPLYLESLAPEGWRSLELVHVTNLFFSRDPRKQNRWQARFSLSRTGPEYLLSVTDPQATERLNNGGRIDKECLVTVSLTEPKKLSHELPELCYKLVAAVIEM